MQVIEPADSREEVLQQEACLPTLLKQLMCSVLIGLLSPSEESHRQTNGTASRNRKTVQSSEKVQFVAQVLGIWID